MELSRYLRITSQFRRIKGTYIYRIFPIEPLDSMATRYAKELNGLSKVYDAARKIDVSSLCRAVEGWMHSPMIMVGSGGSYSTASIAAFLHERSSNQLARAATPLELAGDSLPKAGIACFSASGRNRDIVSAFRTASRWEVDPLSVLVLSDDSPLHTLAARYHYTDLITLAHPTFKDSFLALASLVASALLLLRAYRTALGRPENELPDSLASLVNEVTSFSELNEISPSMDAVTKRQFVSVLYSQPLNAAAIDLESRFVEAALGALHVADLRNFGHGRHVWLAKKAATTGVIALISEEQSALGYKTVALLPDDAAIQTVKFCGPSDLQALAGLVVGVCIAESAGRQAAIDPGKPGVPAFGRQLYRLKPDGPVLNQQTLNQMAAIRRKGGACEPSWIEHHRRAYERFNKTLFGALVFDYDGTLCDVRGRFDPLSPAIAKELTRLCEAGAPIGIATGRGPSTGEELRNALPATVHQQILVGYYNCAVIRPLTDATDPLLAPLETNHPMVATLSTDDLFGGAKFRANEAQISINFDFSVRFDEAVNRVQTLLHNLDSSATVVISGHSIDVLLKAQSKRRMIAAIANDFHVQDPCLRFGDKGRWPGNDAELLDDPFALSVDEVSPYPDRCWSLAPAGIKGIQATLYYLRRLRWTKKGGRLKLTQGARG